MSGGHEGHGTTGTAPTSPQPAATGPAATQTNVMKYICPMPEHVSIEYDHPGKCPLCGMTLVPVSSAALAKIHPGGKLLYYTCPMPEHSDVHESKPGKCPKCGMTLIPVMEQPRARARTPTRHAASSHARPNSTPAPWRPTRTSSPTSRASAPSARWTWCQRTRWRTARSRRRIGGSSIRWGREGV